MQSCPIFCFLFLFNSDRDREQKNVLQEAWKKLGLGKWNFSNGNSKVTENRQDGVYDKNVIFGTKLDLIRKCRILIEYFVYFGWNSHFETYNKNQFRWRFLLHFNILILILDGALLKYYQVVK